MSEANKPAAESGSTWPEQDAIDAWISEVGLDVRFGDSYKLKRAVTDIRIAETERHNDMLALVERVAELPINAGKHELHNISNEARRILGRGE